MKSSPRIVVLGSINMDLVVRCAELPIAGQTVLAESSTEFCGGKGANQAVAATAAGGSVSMIGAVGSDAFAGRLLGNLSQHNVSCDAVEQRRGQSSGLAVISVDQRGQNAIMVVSGANASVTRDDVMASKDLIERSDVILVQLEIPMDAVLAGIDIAKKAGVRVVLDPAPAPREFPSQLLAVDLLCPNESEAAVLTGQPVESVADARRAAAQLQQMGAEHVAITLGDQGTLLHRSGESHLIAAFSVNAVDTTAAGDAFAGALATRWSQTDDLYEAVRFANAAGALAASQHGAQASMADGEAIESLLQSQS
ncbi:ribokinase [Allorhodopirellula solitaria]|uniref:Ribokinase n=1 Tax=Allorhodopirellula solitaria TaxID=2527987 RepID=A0A5C5X0Q5_9BACT|nr:ribokinase [Allorhodopirellula solitaria]TWT56390.1 Ribokinase [Allorhodopirellula solitaria]